MTAYRALALFVAAALFVGCNHSDSSTDATPIKKDAAKDAAGAAKDAGSAAKAAGSTAAPEYIEVPAGTNLYVVSSKEAAAKAAAGKLEKPVRAIGYGEPGQKVYFEEKNQPWLEAEYNKRHPK